MPEDFRITGAEQLSMLGARLKAAGERELRLQLLRGIRAGAKPLVKDAKDAARAKLPKAGGLNERVAREPMQIRNRLSGKSVGVRIVTKTPDTRSTNRGSLRHPVFGHADRWVTQADEAARGWFDDTIAASAPKVQAELLKVMQEVSTELTKRLI